MGVKTNRDSWVYDYSADNLKKRMNAMIDFYNEQVATYSKIVKRSAVLDVVISDQKKIKWTEDLVKDVERGTKHHFDRENIRVVFRKPFCRQWLYLDKSFNWTHHLMRNLIKSS